MPPQSSYRPDPRLTDLGPDFADPVKAADFPQTLLRFRNDRAAATVGLETLSDAEWVAHFGRFQPLAGNLDPPLAQRYHGHQFRVYNPDLGDGRGFTFAQLREAGTDRLLDLGTKGSGRTPWSRDGDGRLTLKGERHATLAASRPADYIARVAETGRGFVSDQALSPLEAAEERLLLGLRIEAGVAYGEVAALGLSPDHAEVRHLVDLGLLVADPLRLRASPAGRLVLNALTERLALAR